MQNLHKASGCESITQSVSAESSLLNPDWHRLRWKLWLAVCPAHIAYRRLRGFVMEKLLTDASSHMRDGIAQGIRPAVANTPAGIVKPFSTTLFSAEPPSRTTRSTQPVAQECKVHFF
ncbi:hypothetical protein [Paraburkholderia caffeinilytica]|uniref:hypothetical protein n=1 Tax=Paraburkholderia caffeinilytica TaxID=1761016 RepID=UPI003DA0885E